MILDNENKNLKVHEWISEYTENGEMDIVTGYFTVGALALISRQVNEKIKTFRLVLGDIVNIDLIKDRTIDLLNENINIEAALRLSTVAKEAVEFLKQDKVMAKTLEPNFCHAKVYLFNPAKDVRHKYFITGSSNLTEAGLGLKQTNNVELNIAETGDNSRYQELVDWFNHLWECPQAHEYKTIIDEKNKETKIPFKEYLIEAIEKIFIKYTPKQLYYKVLFELFGKKLLSDQDNPEFNRQVGKLENTSIYNALYEFQRKGVLSLIRMLQKYNGAILADAVGLGKTWSALAVMKFFHMKGYEIILLCPKKLHYNWHRYKKNQKSRFEKDKLEYFIRYHTDLQLERMKSYEDTADQLFTDDKPRLFVIDESHNLRNNKSQRYNFLLNEILKKNSDAKVLMLSATPINNTLIDIRNQFLLMKQGFLNGFYDDLGIRNIDYTFRRAQSIFNEWKNGDDRKIGDFIKALPDAFFKLTDSLTVSRTRAMIENHKTLLHFPKKDKPKNIYVTPSQIGNFDNFEELLDHFPPLLSGYQPSFYIEQAEDVDRLHDERQRDRFLVKMLYILLVKRLESSWFSFHSTVKKILEHHQNALDRIKKYNRDKKDFEIKFEESPDLEDEELSFVLDEFTLGKKRIVSLKEIDKTNNIDNLRKDLIQDIDALELLDNNLNKFAKEVKKEISVPNNKKSGDDKIQSLMLEIDNKRQAGGNDNNQKILIFTVYKDTAFYLYEQLTARGYNNIAVVSGDASKTDDCIHETKKFEPILERFAPFTKLFKEKEWEFIPNQNNLSSQDEYTEWKLWVKKHDKKTWEKIHKPIDILIATDVLSEGQNLQDCDMVINYDIHWNPVRVIQRMGRIDRIGSPNNIIYGINYWPSDNINNYLYLKGRIEERMAMMKLAGSEVHLEFSDTFREMAYDKSFEDKMSEKMLKQMETSWDDIEQHESGLGFDDLSLENFRQDLFDELQKNENYYKNMPNGVYTGFARDDSLCTDTGIIALLGFPSKPPKALNHTYQTYDLIYIDMNGEQILLNQKEILEALAQHKGCSRFIPDAVERGEENVINELASALKIWIKKQAEEEEIQADGTVKKRAGAETKNVLEKLKKGNKFAVQRMKKNEKVSDKYQTRNFDLITWFLVN